MSRAGWLVLAGCASAPPPPPPVANRSVAVVPPACDHTLLAGTIVDAKSNEPIAGVTLIASTSGQQTEAAISHETGKFTLQQIPAGAVLSLYYADLTFRGQVPQSCTAVTIVLDIGLEGGNVYPVVLR